MNILYYGRFQPPHKGHFQIVKHFLKKYKDSRIIISLDVRRKDESNPFSYRFRRKIFLENLSCYKNRIIITKHKCKNFTYSGCLLPTYENAKMYGKIGLVIGGPDLPRESVEFWNKKNIRVETLSKRFFDLSATDIRKTMNAKKLGFSIITNFGCKYNHWYCVWKNFHKLKNFHTTFENTDWEKLDELIKWYPGKKINVSGGLDPLYNYRKNRKWWNRLFRVAEANGKLLDVHTREFVFEKSFLSKVNKLVISFDDLEEIRHQVVRYCSKQIKIRLAKVITGETTLEELIKIVDFGKKYGFQITFKELYGFDDKKNFFKLKNKMKKLYDFKKLKIRFLEHGDYNIYYMPDNKIYEKFLV